MGTLHPLIPPERKGNAPGAPLEVEVALGVLLGLLWVASVARVAAAASHHEVFGAEASLAFVCLIAIPCAALRAWWQRRVPRRKHHEVAPISSLSRRAAGSTRRRCDF